MAIEWHNVLANHLNLAVRNRHLDWLLYSYKLSHHLSGDDYGEEGEESNSREECGKGRRGASLYNILPRNQRSGIEIRCITERLSALVQYVIL